MAEMTPRERVWTALNHQEPDRVPLDIGGGTSTTIVVEGYETLKDFWGISAEPRIMNKAFRLARMDEEAMLRLESDCRPLNIKAPANWTPPVSEDPNLFVDLWGITWRKAFYPGGYYWELYKNPLAEASIEDLDRYPWPDPLDPGFTAGLEDDARLLYENTPYAIMADGGFKSFWEVGYMLRGLTQFLEDLVANPEFVTAMMEKLLEINIAGTRRFLEKTGKYITVIRSGDDLATQNSLLMSPKTYRKLLKPVYKRYFDFVHSMTDAKVFYHSCGRVNGLIDDLAEIGVEILNPVQVSAMGDTAELKQCFGSKVTFWGGIDTQSVLPNGTPQDVEEEVRHRIRDLGPGGGFVLASVHNIQPDVSPQNIMAMSAAARKYGKYPIQL